MPIDDDMVRPDIVVEVRVNGVLNGQNCLNVFHYRSLANGNPAPQVPVRLFDVCSAFRQIWKDNILPFVTLDYQVRSYQALKPSRVDPVVAPDGTTNYKITYLTQDLIQVDDNVDRGLAAGAKDASLAAISVRKFTGHMDRTTRGGFRLPPTNKDLNNNNLFEAQSITDLQANISAIAVAWAPTIDSDVDMQLGVFSRKRTADNGNIVSPIESMSDVRRLLVRGVVSSQISRKQNLKPE